MPDSPLPDADPADLLDQQAADDATAPVDHEPSVADPAPEADALEQRQPADDATAPVDHSHERSIADPVPEADAIEQSQPVPDPEGNGPEALDPD